MTTYAYLMDGEGADGQTWTVKGLVRTQLEGDFSIALKDAQRDAFMQLTQGKAEYGRPGVGCCGPYKITRFVIERLLTNPTVN